MNNNLTTPFQNSTKIQDCSHGELIKEVCSCDWGWFGDSCTEPGRSQWSSSWLAFRIIFTALYLLLFLKSSFNLYSILQQEKIVGTTRLILRIFRCPKNLCLFYLFCATLLRVLWLLIDPFGFDDKLSRVADRLLYETVYPLLYGLYASVLLVWGGLYQGMKAKSSDPFKILRMLIMAMMMIAFPMSITISILKAKRVGSDIWTPVAVIFVISGVLIMVISFLVFGFLLSRYIKKNVAEPGEEIEYSSVDIESKELDNSIPEQLISTRREYHKLTVKPKRVSFMNDVEISWDTFVKKDFEEPEKNECVYFEEVLKSKEFDRKKTYGKYISALNKGDKRIFFKLCTLLFVSTVLGVVVLIFLAVLAQNNNSLKRYQMASLYFVFFFELIAFWLIYFVFTTQIKVKDKNYLRFFTSLSINMSKVMPILNYPKTFKKIGGRLKEFYN